jgi:hypothetical protein
MTHLVQSGINKDSPVLRRRMRMRQRDAMQSLEFILFEGLTNYELEMGFRNFETV